MKVTIESTTKIVQIEVEGRTVPARVWEGTTARGTPVFCLVTRIAPAIFKHDLSEETVREFERDLQECADSKLFSEPRSFDLRMIL